MVENEDPSIGGLVEISTAYRLRHISSGLYLAVNTDLQPCLAKDCTEGTLWNIIPLEPDNNYIRVDEMCFIINTSTQRTISVTEIPFQVLTLPCVQNTEVIDEDSVFKITKAGGEIVWETFFLLHCYPILRGFGSFIKHEIFDQPPEIFDMIYEIKLQFNLIENCIVKLIQFCNNKLEGMIGIDNHYGEVQQIRQKMLKEQNFFEVLANILDTALKDSMEPELIYRAIRELEKNAKEEDKGGKKDDKNIDPEIFILKNIAGIIKIIYELLTTLCRKNNDNQIYAYKFFPIFMKHVGLNLGAKDFMLSVLCDNEQLMLSINNPQSIDKGVDLIKDFFDLLKSSSNPIKVILIDFFKSICVFRGQGVTANQEKVLKSMLNDDEICRKTLPQTVISNGKLCITIKKANIPIDHCFESAKIACFPENLLYLTKLLELYANMCVGRNFKVSDELLKQFPFQIIHPLMWDDNLSVDIRAAFCKMLLNLYVDCSPREDVIKPQLIKEFKQIDYEIIDPDQKASLVTSENSSRGDYITVSGQFGESIKFLNSKLNASEDYPLSIEDAQLYELLSHIFEYFEKASYYNSFDCELLRLTSKLMKFELLGMRCTDFDEKKIIQNPAYPKQQLDIVKILKLLIPLLETEAKKNTHITLRRKQSTKIRAPSIGKEKKVQQKEQQKEKHQYIYLSSLLQDTGNNKDPFIRTAANIKNFISSYKQYPIHSTESKSHESRIKLKFSKMLHYYLDCRQDFLLNNIVAWFNLPEKQSISKGYNLIEGLSKTDSEQYNEESIDEYLTEEVLHLLPPIMKFSSHKKFKEFLKHKELAFNCIKGPFIPDLNDLDKKNPFLIILIKAFTYSDNYKVQSSLFRLIMRCYEQRKELLKYINNLLPISTSTDIDLYNWMRHSIKTFANYSEQSELWLKYWEHDRDLQKNYFQNFKNIMTILKNLEAVLFESSVIDNGVLRPGNLDSEVSPSRQKMMNYLDADNLVLALIKDGIHELLSLYTSTDNEKHLRNLTDLFELCFSFLTNFVRNNPQNQKRLYKSLHIFLQHLNIPLGQIELLCEIFRDNLGLIEKIDEKFLGIFKTSVKRYGRRAMFLEIFKVIQVVKGKAVPSIQRIILNMFIPEELDRKLLYMEEEKNSPEFVFEISDSENNYYYDEPFEYHAVLLEVLAKCGYGVTGMYFNEAKCQNIVSLANIFNILTYAEDTETSYNKLKLPMLDFFFNIYLDCEMLNIELKTCEKFIEYIHLQIRVLNELEFPEQYYIDCLFVFLKILLKYRQSYIKKDNSLYYHSNDINAIKEFIMALSTNFYKLEDLAVDEEFISTMKDLKKSLFSHQEISDEASPTLPEVGHTPSESLKPMRDVIKITSTWNKFKDYLIYSSKIKEKVEEEEQALLVAIYFSSELDSKLSFENIVKSVVNFIRLSRSQQPPLSLTISAIELLTRILARPIHDKYTNKEEAKKTLQNSMVGYGMVRVLFGLLCDSNLENQIFKSLITVCIELLDGGNGLVQSEIFLYFMNMANSQTFFERVHYMFVHYIDKFAHGQVANEKRSKVYKQKRDDIKSLLRLLQLFCEGHNQELQDYIRYQSRSRNSFDIISDIISLLELLLEKKLSKSFKVISQCFDTLTEFIQGPCLKNQETIINGKFLELVSGLLAMGIKEENNPGGQQPNETENLSEDLDFYKKEKSALEDWMISHLKYKALITVLSLMEGRTDNYITKRLIRSFNIEVLKDNLIQIFIEYSELYGPNHYNFDLFNHIDYGENYTFGYDNNKENKYPIRFYSLVIENGFMIYHLLKTFMDNNDIENQEIIAGELDQLQRFLEDQDQEHYSKHHLAHSDYSEETIREAVSTYKFPLNSTVFDRSKDFLLNATYRFFDMHTGKIEIIFHGNIFRIYFPHPFRFESLTEEIQENFHLNVQRDTDQTKLIHLIRESDSIIEQIHHEHYLINLMQNNKLVHLFVSRLQIWRELAFALSVVLNLLVLLSYSNYHDHDRMYGPSLFNYSFEAKFLDTEITKDIILAIGIIQLLCCLMVLALFLLRVGYIVAEREWRNHEPSVKFFQSKPGVLKIAILRGKQVVLTVYYVLINFDIIYHIAYTLFSFLGTTVHPFYFSLLLLDILYKYRSLQNVIQSFILPIRTLLLTFALMVVFIYIFAIFGFFYFNDDFEGGCKTLYWCTIFVWDAGFKTFGLIGGHMKLINDGGIHTQRFLYDNFYYILIEIIIMKVVEGLIVDTFAILREQEEKSNTDRETKCFVCGLERDYIERKTNMPFLRHVQVDHSEWNYILFLAHLKRKLQTEYTGYETYIKGQVDRHEVAWIPNHRTISINDVTEGEDMENLKKIKGMSKKLKKLGNKLRDMKMKFKHSVHV